MTRARHTAVAAALLVLLASCGEPSGFQAPGDDTSTSVTAVATTSTTEGLGSTTSTTGADPDGTTTTTEPADESTTTTTPEAPADPFSVDALLALEPGPLPELTGTAAIIGATPERGIAAALTAELAATGTDLTGTRLDVRPVTGTGESLLVFWIDDTATALADDETAMTILLPTLLGSQIIEEASITRIVINYQSADADGPFVLTVTAEIDKMIGAIENDESLAEEDMLMQFTRLGSP